MASVRFEPVQEKWLEVEPFIHISLIGEVGWLYF